ncbi:MAG TPA: DUF4834 family protein [Mucilaginibacter sp.]|jgi:hypothetical protein|nr:DUF4834 family protein [Mucilaginibacter sp.]
MYFIRFLLIAILVLYIIRSLIRILLPMLFQSLVNKAQQQQGQQQQQYRNPKQPEGKIKVDYIPQTKNQVPDSEGDFVDFEEIK